MVGERTTFFGRERELEQVVALLASGRRIVTITGSAGIGKTRLARRVMTTEEGGWEPDGVWFCDCSSATDASAMVVASARNLGLNVGSAAEVSEIVELVGRALAGHPSPLLVLDNVEHLLPEVAHVVSRWLDAAPTCQILVTSRELLRIEGECVHELGPLPQAVDLFLDRARLLRPEYASTDADRRIVERIVRRLDGIPLAVELAAARARVLSPAALLQQLEAHIEVISHGPRRTGARRSTMAEALSWSWNLLEQAEQDAMAVLSIFCGGFCFEDAQRVLGDTCGTVEPDVLDLVQALRDKSLLHEVDTSSPGGAARFKMYEVIRSYGRAKLVERGLQASANEFHARHFVERGERMLHDCPVDQFASTMTRLALDRENLESILERCSASEDPATLSICLRTAVLLGAIAGEDGLPPMQAQVLDQLLDRSADGVEPGLVLRSRLLQATKRTYTGQPARAEQDCQAILASAQTLGDDRLVASVYLALGAALLRQGKASEAWAALRQAEVLCRRVGDVPGEQHALCQQGGCAHSLGKADAALDHFERGLALARAWGLVRGQIRAEAGLGSHFLDAGDYDASREHLERCGVLARSVGFRRSTILVMGHLGILNFDHDRLGEALECLAAAVAEAGETGDDVPEGVFLAAEGAVRAAMGDPESAAPLVAKAQRVLANSPLFGTIVEVYAGHVDVALARFSSRSGDPGAAAERLNAARARVQRASCACVGTTRYVEQSDDLRIALRLLERALSRYDDELSTSRPQDAASSHAPSRLLVVGEGGAWFELGGLRVDMSRRSTSRAILLGLVEKTIAGEGHLTVDELLVIGWPGEKMARSSALNRLYVALATLRSLGLREVIERHPQGYTLNARIKWG